MFEAIGYNQLGFGTHEFVISSFEFELHRISGISFIWLAEPLLLAVREENLGHVEIEGGVVSQQFIYIVDTIRFLNIFSETFQ